MKKDVIPAMRVCGGSTVHYCKLWPVFDTDTCLYPAAVVNRDGRIGGQCALDANRPTATKLMASFPAPGFCPPSRNDSSFAEFEALLKSTDFPSRPDFSQQEMRPRRMLRTHRRFRHRWPIAVRGGRVDLHRDRRRISGCSAGCFLELPIWGVMQEGRSLTGVMPPYRRPNSCCHQHRRIVKIRLIRRLRGQARVRSAAVVEVQIPAN